MSSLNSAQPVNWSHLPIQHITNIHTAAEHCTIGSTKWLSDGDIMYSCGLILMCGSCNGTVKQCKVKEQSIYRPTNAICDTPFVTYIYCYMFRHRGAFLRDSSKETCTTNITAYFPYVKCLFWCHSNTKHNIKLDVLGEVSSKSILFQFNTFGVHPPSNGKDPYGNSMGLVCDKCVQLTFRLLSQPFWIVRETFTPQSIKTHALSTTDVNRKCVRGPIIQFKRNRQRTNFRHNSNNPESDIS